MNKNDFPIFANHPELVYLDSAATSQKPQAVIDCLAHYYQYSNANIHRGIYKLAEEATTLYESSREIAALHFGVEPHEIVFTPGATAGLNFVAFGVFEKNINPKDTMLVTEMEHHSNLLPWQQIAMRKKARIEAVNVKEYKLDLTDLQQKLEKLQPKLLAFTHVSNSLGTVNPVGEIVKMTRELSPSTIIIVDGTQAAPHLKLDLKKLDVDFYAIAGHKMLGPTGIGILYGKKQLLESMDPMITGGGMIRKVELKSAEWAPIPEKLEAGTPNIADAIALGEAIRYLNKTGMDKIIRHEQELTAYTLAKLNDISKLKVLGPENLEDRSGVFSITIEGIHPHDIAQVLDEENIAIRAGHHCNQVLMREVLHIPATARISTYLYNDYKDIDRLEIAIDKLKHKFGVS